MVANPWVSEDTQSAGQECEDNSRTLGESLKLAHGFVRTRD